MSKPELIQAPQLATQQNMQTLQRQEMAENREAHGVVSHVHDFAGLLMEEHVAMGNRKLIEAIEQNGREQIQASIARNLLMHSVEFETIAQTAPPRYMREALPEKIPMDAEKKLLIADAERRPFSIVIDQGLTKLRSGVVQAAESVLRERDVRSVIVDAQLAKMDQLAPAILRNVLDGKRMKETNDPFALRLRDIYEDKFVSDTSAIWRILNADIRELEPKDLAAFEAKYTRARLTPADILQYRFGNFKILRETIKRRGIVVGGYQETEARFMNWVTQKTAEVRHHDPETEPDLRFPRETLLSAGIFDRITQELLGAALLVLQPNHVKRPQSSDFRKLARKWRDNPSMIQEFLEGAVVYLQFILGGAKYAADFGMFAVMQKLKRLRPKGKVKTIWAGVLQNIKVKILKNFLPPYDIEELEHPTTEIGNAPCFSLLQTRCGFSPGKPFDSGGQFPALTEFELNFPEHNLHELAGVSTEWTRSSAPVETCQEATYQNIAKLAEAAGIPMSVVNQKLRPYVMSR